LFVIFPPLAGDEGMRDPLLFRRLDEEKMTIPSFCAEGAGSALLLFLTFLFLSILPSPPYRGELARTETVSLRPLLMVAGLFSLL